MRKLRHGLVVVALMGGVLVGGATSAGAGSPVAWSVTDAPSGFIDELVLGLENNGGSQCDDSGTDVNFYDVDDALLDTAPLSGANAGTVVVPDDLADTAFRLTVSCSAGTGGADREFLYAGLDVTKAVEGTPTAGTSFVIRVDCERQIPEEGPANLGPHDLTFDADGGTDRVWFSGPHSCELTETDDGGADSTTIVSEDCDGGLVQPAGLGDEDEVSSQGEQPGGNGAELVAINGPTQCDATVTNTFADPTTTSTTTTTIATTTTTDGDVSPSTATPATPTQASPTFTG